MVQESSTQPAAEGRLEAHRRYIDAHMPGRELDGPGTFRKIVLKIRVDEEL